MHPPVVPVRLYQVYCWDTPLTCHRRHFTQVVAMGPFAILGLVLMACTARVCRITGITALYEEIGSEDMKTVFRLMDAGEMQTIGGLLAVGDEDSEVDEGEVVQRDE